VLLEVCCARGILATGLIGLRFVTHLDVDAAGIDRTLAAVREFFALPVAPMPAPPLRRLLTDFLPDTMSISNTDALTRVIEHREIFHDEMLTLMRRIMNGDVAGDDRRTGHRPGSRRRRWARSPPPPR
jgi:hypothetical protein